MKAILFSLMLILASTSFSQTPDALLTEAVVAFENGQYKSALEKLEMALSNTDLLKPKNVAKAWYYKGLSLEAYVSQLYQEKNAEELKYHTTAYLDIYEAFVLCIKADDKFKYEQKIINRFEGLQSTILKKGEEYSKAGQYELARAHYLTSLQINELYLIKSVYKQHDLLAEIELVLKDTVQAYSQSLKTVQKYKQTPNSYKDYSIGHTYYRLANLAYNSSEINDLDLAIKWTDLGIDLLEKNRDSLRDKDIVAFSKLEKEINEAIVLLSNYRLDPLVQEKNRINRELESSKKAVEQKPKDYTRRITYAKKLEFIDDLQGAIKQYEAAIKIDSKALIANLSLGKIYSNAGKLKFNASMKIDNDEKVSLIQNEGKELIRLSIPYLEKAHKADSKNLTVIKTLKNNFLLLEIEDEYQKYNELENSLLNE